MFRTVSRTALRFVSVLVLSLWMTPGAGALAVGLHLAMDHHGPHGSHGAAEHGLEISDLLQTAAHGHHHPDAEAAPAHDHDATIEGAGSRLRPSAPGIAVLKSASPEIGLSERALAGGSLRRGPPRSLFTSHCSLLL